jgi:uncharacterized membrane protein (UPF0127 family)
MASRSLILFALLPLVAAALLLAPGCEETPPRAGAVKAVIKGKTFWLDPVLDEASRIKGLGDRDGLPDDGGMLFIFPLPSVLQFVMRDCKFDIDIAFLDDSGRVLAMHTMKMDPRKPGEGDMEYEQRLARYSSRFATRVAVEVMGGTFAKLGLKVQDKIEVDLEALKGRVK